MSNSVHVSLLNLDLSKGQDTQTQFVQVSPMKRFRGSWDPGLACT